MKYAEYKPIEALSKYIQLIWAIKSESPKDIYPREKIMPDGIVKFVFHIKGFINTNELNKELSRGNKFVFVTSELWKTRLVITGFIF